jgi:hypothetical protein
MSSSDIASAIRLVYNGPPGYMHELRAVIKDKLIDGFPTLVQKPAIGAAVESGPGLAWALFTETHARLWMSKGDHSNRSASPSDDREIVPGAKE